jgi:spermidine/putrescine transport system permease protein
LVSPGDALYPGAFAVFIVMTCDFLPFLALPYASVEKLIGRWQRPRAIWRGPLGRFRHALLPQIAPGLMAGALLVFISATGQFVIPDLMGGAKTVLLGNAIQQQFGFSRDWPFGSAIACVAMVIVMLCLWGFSRTVGKEGRENLL